MATKPELNKAVVYEKIKANKYNENFDILLNYIEEVSDELMLKVNTINSQLSSSILSNLQSVYPIGSLYIGVTDNCPIANLFGTWEKVAEGLCLQGATGSQVPGDTVEASLTIPTTGWGTTGGAPGNITAGKLIVGSGRSEINEALESLRAAGNDRTLEDANMQPPAYLVNVWKRTA
jgi:hypothetical protein